MIGQLGLKIRCVRLGHIVDIVGDSWDVANYRIQLAAQIVVVLVGQSADVGSQVDYLGHTVRLDPAINHGGGHRHSGKRPEHRGESWVVPLDFVDNFFDVFS